MPLNIHKLNFGFKEWCAIHYLYVPLCILFPSLLLYCIQYPVGLKIYNWHIIFFFCRYFDFVTCQVLKKWQVWMHFNPSSPYYKIYTIFMFYYLLFVSSQGCGSETNKIWHPHLIPESSFLFCFFPHW